MTRVRLLDSLRPLEVRKEEQEKAEGMLDIEERKVPYLVWVCGKSGP